MRYSVDTSALIEGWFRKFPIDIIPGFWERLDELIQTGDLRATEEVLIELEKKHDEVFEWAKQRPELFVPIDMRIQEVVREILSDHKTLIDSRKNRPSADPFVIALARINGCKVLTEEMRSGSNKRPHIPDVCDAYNINCMNLVDLTRHHGWQFHS